MIPQIQIDLGDLINEFNLSTQETKGLINYSIQELTSVFYERWIETAGNELHSTRDQYIQSIIIGGEENVGFVKLLGEFPNMIEDGGEAFDMKEGFKNSPKATQTKSGGWYLTIPFRHGTPNSLAENSVFSGRLPEEVYQAVRKKDNPSPNSKSAGLAKGEISSPYNIPNVRPVIITKSKIFEEYIHKHSIFEGLQRSTMTYEKATQGQYISFRRVSDQSDDNAWIHKVMEAKNLMEKALDNFSIEQEIDKSVDNYLNSLGF